MGSDAALPRLATNPQAALPLGDTLHDSGRAGAFLLHRGTWGGPTPHPEAHRPPRGHGLSVGLQRVAGGNWKLGQIVFRALIHRWHGKWRDHVAMLLFVLSSS